MLLPCTLWRRTCKPAGNAEHTQFRGFPESPTSRTLPTVATLHFRSPAKRLLSWPNGPPPNAHARAHGRLCERGGRRSTFGEATTRRLECRAPAVCRARYPHTTCTQHTTPTAQRTKNTQEHRRTYKRKTHTHTKERHTHTHTHTFPFAQRRTRLRKCVPVAIRLAIATHDNGGECRSASRTASPSRRRSPSLLWGSPSARRGRLSLDVKLQRRRLHASGGASSSTSGTITT